MMVPKKRLHVIDRRPIVDQDARIAVPKIVDPHLRQIRQDPRPIPCQKESVVRLAKPRVEEDEVTCPGRQPQRP